MRSKYSVLGAGLLALSFVAWLLTATAPAGFALILLQYAGIPENIYINYLILGISELILLAPLVVYMLVAKTDIRALMGNRTNLTQNLLAAAIGVLLAPALQGVSVFFAELFSWLGAKMPDTSMMEPISFGSMLVGMVAIGATAGIVEEPIFRGVLLRGLGSAAGRRKAVILSAVVFSIIHLEIVGAPTRFIIGVLLGYMAWRCGAILPGIIVHAAYNSTVVGMSLLFSTTLKDWNGFAMISGASDSVNAIVTWAVISVPFALLAVGVYVLFAQATPAAAAWNERPYVKAPVKFAHCLPWIGAGLAGLVLTLFTAATMWLEPILEELTRMTEHIK